MRPLFAEVKAASHLRHSFLKTKCQMKDMDTIFPLIPCELLQVKWSDHNSPAMSVIFPKISKLLKMAWHF